MVAYIIFSLILFGILIYLSIFQIMKYNHSYNLSTLYTNTVNHKNHLIKYYNYLRTIIIYNSYRNEKNKIGEIYEIMKLNMNNTFKTNQDKFIEIFESMNPLNNKEKEKLNNIINEDICEYLNLNNTYYTISCDELGDSKEHKCTSCKDDLIPELTSNCYEKCPNGQYYYFDDSNQYHCISTCPADYNIIQPKLKCTKDCKKDPPFNFK